MKSPFKVMSTAALAAAVAVPTLSVPAADAAETSSFHSVALETEDGSVKTVPFTEYAKAKTFGTGELGAFVEANSVVAVSAEEGTFVSVRTLALAKIENPDADTAALLADLDDSEDNQVAEEDVAEYTEWTDEEEEEVAPAVESVSANNLKTLTVNFNSEIDKSTVAKDDTVAIDGVSISSASLLDDKKTLKITLPTPDQSAEYDLTLEGLETVDGVELDKYEETVKTVDTESPALENIEILNSKTLKLHTSEPIKEPSTVSGASASYQILSSVKVDETSLPVSVEPNAADNTVLLTFGSKLSVGEHTLSLKSFEDYAGFKADSEEFSFEIVEDNEAPAVVSAEAVTKSSVAVTFNEPVEQSDLGTFEINGGTATVDSSQTSEDKKTYVFDLNNDLDLGATVETKVTYVGTTDFEGNTVSDEETFTFQVADDTVKPVYSEVELASGNAVNVSFSEKMSDGGTVTVKQDGEVVEEDVPVALNSDKDGATLPASNLGISNSGGTYTLEFSGAKDASVRENQADSFTHTIVASDVVPPTATFISGATNDTVEVYFDEAMDLNTLMDKENYIVNGDYLTSLDDAELDVATDGHSVTVTLDDNTAITDVTLLSLKDEAGNTITNFNDKVLASSFNSTPTLNGTLSAEATAKDTVQVTIPQNSNSEQVKLSSIDPSTFAIYDGADPQAVATSADTTYNADGTTTVTLEFNTDLDDVATTDGAFDLKVSGDLTKDQYGNSLTDQYTTASIDDAVRPSVTKAEDIAGGIKLTFSEDLANASVGSDVESDVVVKDASGSRVAFSDTDVTEVSDGVVTIKGISAGDDYTVEVIPSSIVDVNGNLVTPFASETIDVEANQAPTVDNTISNQTGSVEGGNETVDVSNTFSDAEGDSLSLTASSDDSTIASASVSGTDVVVTPNAKGTATITVTADDGEGNTTDETFDFTVENSAPTVENAISDQTQTAGDGDFTVDLESASPVFNDADGETLSYTVNIESDPDSILTNAAESGGTVTLTEEGTNTGTATVSVTATDGTDSVTETFDVTNN